MRRTRGNYVQVKLRACARHAGMGPPRDGGSKLAIFWNGVMHFIFSECGSLKPKTNRPRVVWRHFVAVFRQLPALLGGKARWRHKAQAEDNGDV